MRNLEKHPKYLFFLTMLFFVGYLEVKVQPTCFANFPVSESCNQYYLDIGFVCVGKLK